MNDPTLRVAVIVPAYNEENRIAIVLQAVIGSKLASEIIVVSDGSTDKTAAAARKVKGVRVVDLPYNVGKGGAMAAGVASTKAKVIAFVDADLIGLLPEHVDQIIKPILDRQCDMCVGIFRGGKVWSDTAQRITPYLSGQRAMNRELFEGIPFIAELRMGVEVALNSAARRRKSRVVRVVLRGVSNCHKEQKLGLMKGLKARGLMYKEITEAMMRSGRKRRPTRRYWI